MSDLRAIRTDIVGSLLRPRTVIEGRGRLDEGKIDAAAMRAIEDDAVDRKSTRLNSSHT